jgi:hypothetical protein
MLVAISILLGVASRHEVTLAFQWCFSLLGLCLCGVWWLTTRRTFAQCREYFLHLTKLEDKLPQDEQFFKGPGSYYPRAYFDIPRLAYAVIVLIAFAIAASLTANTLAALSTSPTKLAN